jgi:hypothetical protein
MHTYRSTYVSNVFKVSDIDVIISQNNTKYWVTITYLPNWNHTFKGQTIEQAPPLVVPLLPLPLSLPLPLPLVLDCLPPPIELAFSVSFVGQLTLALGKNNANRLTRIKFQQEHFVGKIEFNWNIPLIWLFQRMRPSSFD